MIFRCRFVLPTQSNWIEVEETNAARAVNELHSDRWHAGHSFTQYDSEGRRTDVNFARIEVEGIEGTFVSRVYKSGLYRKGGVTPRHMTEAARLQKLVEAIAWTGPVEELFEPGWEEEEDQWT